MTDIIPPQALEAGKDSAFAWLRSYMEDDVRVREMTDDELTELVNAACLAMLKNWPGMWHIEPIDFEGKIILPLPKEGFTEGHCEHRKSPGGCQLHNLQCGYPDCDRRGRKHE